MRARWAVAAVWLVHGLFNKLLGGSPRHLAIVQAVPGLGGARGRYALLAVGVFEVAIAAWVLSRRAPKTCAAIQTAALLSMNVVELTYARPLLLWPAGLLPLNIGFLAVAWVAAGWRGPARMMAALRRHPLAIDAHFDECLTLVYAAPAAALRAFVPPGLELDTVDGNGFIAIALVQTRGLRPSALPAVAGRDFFLAGYRIFTRFHTPHGRTLRGLRILRSDTDSRLMEAAGNALTHYNYQPCTASIAHAGDRLDISVRTSDGGGDLEVRARLDERALPPGSPFATEREARRFAGPLPFTFDYERETHAIVAIEASRAGWRPQLTSVTVPRAAFFDGAAFGGVTPVLAAAFHTGHIDYHWKRGVRHAL